MGNQDSGKSIDSQRTSFVENHVQPYTLRIPKLRFHFSVGTRQFVPCYDLRGA